MRSLLSTPTSPTRPARRSRVRSALLLSGLLLSVLAPTVAFAATPASAAPCSGTSCAGRDPQQTGCANDAVGLVGHDYKAENSASFRLELRYSPACRAGWLRIVQYSGGNVGYALSAWNPNSTTVGTSGGNGNVAWTSMVSASGRQVCGGTQFYVNGRWVRWYFVGCYAK